MNKKFLILGAFGVAAFAALTAFGPKQDAQKAEISAAVTSQLEEFRATQQAACDERVAVAAKTKFDEYIAAMPAPAAAKPTAVKKKGGAKGPKVDPLPQPTKPKTDPQKERGGTTTPEQQKKREGTITPEQQKKRGGQSGSGNGGE